MTDAPPSPLSTAERVALTVLLVGVGLLATLDAVSDWGAGGSLGQVLAELAVAAGAAAGVALLWARYVRARSELQSTRHTLERARADAELWQRRNEATLRGLAAAIDQQLESWRLTAAEKEVAFLLLKGLSFKEIAVVRGAGERTVRQQALAVYAKSGLGGRAELAAFFLEDLLVPTVGDDGAHGRDAAGHGRVGSG